MRRFGKILVIFTTMLTFSIFIFPNMNNAEAAGNSKIEADGRVNVSGSTVDTSFSLTIMHVSDSHGHVEQYPKLTTAVKGVLAEKPDSLLVDAGDVFSGTIYFTEYLGKADLWFMNNLSYDAMTLGNHEFDRGTSVLADFIKEAQFPIVTANLNMTKDPYLGPLFKRSINSSAMGGNIYPAIIKTVNGNKVGIFGLFPPPNTVPTSIKVEDAINKAKATVAALKHQGVNKIIVLSHLGLTPDQNLAIKVDGIDVIVGGHQHSTLEQPLVIQKNEPTVIVKAGPLLQYLGVLDVTFDDNGVLTSYDGKLLYVNNYSVDAEAQAKLNELNN